MDESRARSPRASRRRDAFRASRVRASGESRDASTPSTRRCWPGSARSRPRGPELHSSVAWISVFRTRWRWSPGRAAGLGLASAKALAAEGARVMFDGPWRGAARASRGRSRRALQHRTPFGQRLPIWPPPHGVEARRCGDRRGRRSAGSTVLVNNVGLGRGADCSTPHDAEWAEAAFDQTLVSRRSARAGLAVPHMRKKGGGVIIFITSILGRESGGRMTYTRREGGRDQPGQVARAAARARQHPRRERRARIDPLPRRVVAQAPAGRSGRHRRVRSPRSALRALRAAPRKSATSSRFSRRRARAG